MPFSYVINIGNAITTAGPMISNMTWVGSRVIFDGTIMPPDLPNSGDIVRITGTGWIATILDAKQSVPFTLVFPDSIPAFINGVTVTNVPAADDPPEPTEYAFFFEILMTFRDRRGTGIQVIDVESNGIIMFGEGPDYCDSWSFGAELEVGIPLNIQAVVDFGVLAVSLPKGIDVTFDQCVIEYLPAPQSA